MDLLDVFGQHVFLDFFLVVFFEVVGDAGLALALSDIGTVVEVVAVVVAPLDEVLFVGSVDMDGVGLFLDVDVVCFVAVYELIFFLFLLLFYFQQTVGFGVVVGEFVALGCGDACL